MPSEPVSIDARSDSVSPNRLSVTNDIELLRAPHKLHAERVGEPVLKLNIGIFASCKV